MIITFIIVTTMGFLMNMVNPKDTAKKYKQNNWGLNLIVGANVLFLLYSMTHSNSGSPFVIIFNLISFIFVVMGCLLPCIQMSQHLRKHKGSKVILILVAIIVIVQSNYEIFFM